jgi:hypothetical protein
MGISRGLTQSFQKNSGLVPGLSHDSFLPNAFLFIFNLISQRYTHVVWILTAAFVSLIVSLLKWKTIAFSSLPFLFRATSTYLHIRPWTSYVRLG